MTRLTSLMIVVAMLSPATALAQVTPWGDPDIQGIWSNQTPIPLERPAALAKKPRLTREEADALEKAALATTLKNFAADIPTSGEFNEIWLESGKGRVPLGLSTSLVVEPADGRIPFTPEGRVRWQDTPNLMTERQTGKPLGANSWEDRALQERCITMGNVLTPSAFYNNYHQIMQAPGVVVIVSESMHEARVVPLDRRPHVGASIRTWLGDSRGWWEGKTLVVETTNFNDQRRFQGATRALRLVERFTRVDRDTIDYRLTVSDPATFTQPWTLQNIFWRTDEPVFEAGCHEGNLGIPSILAGARAAEKR